MPQLTPDELRVLKVWLASDLIANAIGGDDSPTPAEDDEMTMWEVIRKFA